MLRQAAFIISVQVFYATFVLGENLDFTCFNKYARIVPAGDQNLFIGGYKGGTDLEGDVTFTRIVETGTGDGMPRGSSVAPHRNPKVFATRLFLPAIGQRERIGAYYCHSIVDHVAIKVATVILAKDANVLPLDVSVTTNIGEPVELAVSADNSVDTSQLKWRHNGQLIPDWDGRDIIYITNSTKNDGGIYECYVDGMRSEGRHAIFIVIVRGCPRYKWGKPDCQKDCPMCYNGGVCCPEYGTCICPQGFGGEFCQNVFGRNKFGQLGDLQCSGSSDHGYGCKGSRFCLLHPLGCTCAAGFMGIDCRQECTLGKFGNDCEQTCHCASGPSVCLKDTGECESGGCVPGWTGVNCQECETGKFGQNCDMECHCAAGTSCHFYTGKCEGSCEPGWDGDYCEKYIGLEAFNAKAACNMSVSELSIQSTTVNSVTIQFQPPVKPCADLIYNVKTYLANFDQCDSERVKSFAPQQSNTTSTTLTVSNLKPYSTYVIYVKGMTDNRKIGQEQFILVTTDQQEPSGDPTDIKVKSVNTDSLTFNWDLPPCGYRQGEIISYTYKLTDSNDEILQAGSTEDDAITFTGLQSSTQYSFMVAAETTVGTGPYSELLQQDTQGCMDGRYGKYCNGTCHCALGNSMCDPETGFCVTGGCGVQWYGEDCQGKYCNGTCHCVLGNSMCDPETGFCVTGGFDVQWYGEDCQEPGTVSNAISTIDSTDANTIEIQWDPIAGYPCPGVTYLVEYELISLDQCQLETLSRIQLADEIDQSSATLTGLELHSTYVVYIRSTHLAGNGQPVKIYVQTGESVPDLPPSHAAVDYDTADSVRFSWDMPSCGDRNGEISSYTYRLVDPEGITTEDSTQDNMITFDNLQPDSMYRFSTAAVTSAGIGPFSEPIEYTTSQIVCPVGKFGTSCDSTCHCDLGDNVCDFMTGICTEGECDSQWTGDTCQEPSAVPSVTSTIDNTNTNTIEITWAPMIDYPCPGLDYMVEYELINKDQCKPETDQAEIRLADDIGQSSARLVDLEFYSTYLVYVRAVHPAGNGTIVRRLAQTGETAPTSPPTNVNIYEKTNNSVTFTWKVPKCGHRGGDIGLYLYHLIGLDDIGSKTGSTQDTIITFKDLPPTEYSFYVSASTASGRGPFSVALRYTSVLDEGEKIEEKQCTGTLDIPSNVTATSISTENITFTWSPPPCLLEDQAMPIKYNYKLTSLATNMVVSSDETSDTRLTFQHLEPSSAFMFVVAASPSKDINRFAEPLMASTLANEPVTPSNIQVGFKNQESIFVMWDSNADNIYMINYDIIEMPYNLNFSSDTMRSRRQTSSVDSIEGDSYLLTDLLPSTKYEIQVSSTNADGQSSTPDVFTANTEPADYTYMLVADPPILVLSGMTTNETSVDVVLPEAQSQFHTGYQLAVHRCDTSLPPGTIQFNSYHESPTAYVAAEFSKVAQNLPNIFTVGDNQTYGGFYNAPLQPGYMYFIYFGLVSQITDMESGYSWSPAAKVKILEAVQSDKVLEQLNLTDCTGLGSVLFPNSSLNTFINDQVANTRLWFIIALCVACALFLILICILSVWLIKYPHRHSEKVSETEMLPPTERRGTIGRRSGEYTVTLPRPVPHLGSKNIRKAWKE